MSCQGSGFLKISPLSDEFATSRECLPLNSQLFHPYLLTRALAPISVIYPVNSAMCVLSTSVRVGGKKASLHFSLYCCWCEMSNVSGLAVGGCMLITLGKACSNTLAPVECVIDVLSCSPYCLCFSLWVWLKVTFTSQDSHSFLFDQLFLWLQHVCGLREARSQTRGWDCKCDSECWLLEFGPLRRVVS